MIKQPRIFLHKYDAHSKLYQIFYLDVSFAHWLLPLQWSPKRVLVDSHLPLKLYMDIFVKKLKLSGFLFLKQIMSNSEC